MAVIDKNETEDGTEYNVGVTVKNNAGEEMLDADVIPNDIEQRAIRRARGALAMKKRNTGAIPTMIGVDVDQLEVTGVSLQRELPFSMRAEFNVTFFQEK